MRKRLLIGAIAAAVIGVVIYFLSQPREGTVEWHKTQYLKTLDRLTQNTWKDKLQRAYRRVARRPKPLGISDTLINDLSTFDHHLDSLVQLGYLQRARVLLTNAGAITAPAAGYFGRDPMEAGRRFIAISTAVTAEGRRVVYVVAPPSDLPRIEAAIRKADVPAPK